MRTVRRGVFETNSSSTHAIAWNLAETYKKIDRADVLDLDDWDSVVMDKQGDDWYLRIRKLGGKMRTTKYSLDAKLRYIFGIIGQGLTNRYTGDYLIDVEKMKKHKAYKDFVNDLTKEFKKLGFNLKDVVFGERSDLWEVEDLLGSRYDNDNIMLKCITVKDADGNIIEDPNAKRLLLYERIDKGKLVVSDLDHEVCDWARDAWDEHKSLTSCFGGWRPIDIVTRKTLGISYWRNG